MSQRIRKKARRDAQYNPAPTTVRASPKPPAPSQRSTFKVAAAQRQIAAELPDVIYNRSNPPIGRAAKERPSQRVLTNSVVKPAQSTQPLAKPRAKQQQNTLTKLPDQQLKCRPKQNAPKGGAGSGKKFVPWDKNC